MRTSTEVAVRLTVQPENKLNDGGRPVFKTIWLRHTAGTRGAAKESPSVKRIRRRLTQSFRMKGVGGPRAPHLPSRNASTAAMVGWR
jgi:hypothetical protein